MTRTLFVFSLIAVFSLNAAALAQPPDPARPKEARKPTAEERRKAQRKAKERDVARLLKSFDKDEDGMLQLQELPKALQEFLGPLDKNRDSQFSQEELLKMRGRPSRKAGEIITGAAKGERYDDKLEVGDAAPDFTLSDPTGKRSVTLSDFRGKRPVVLIFGSYT